MPHLFLYAALLFSFTARGEESPRLFPGEIWGAREDAIAEEILAASIATARDTAEGKLVHRDAHPKAHGCVRARWRNFDLTGQLGFDAGILSEPRAEYEAWLRFSNGAPGATQAPDADADVRGLAVKLLGVPGTPRGSQDFVAMSSARFFSRDAGDYADFFRAVRGGKLRLAAYLATHPTNAYIIYQARVKPANPLDLTYDIPVPARAGDSSVRYRFAPCGPRRETKPSASRDFLRENLVASLAAEEACYNVYVQVNENPRVNAIEDPTLAWNEEESPFRLAAQLLIPRQSGIDSPEQRAFCENVAFDPWNTQEALRPLGQINRIRKKVYEGVAAFRHGQNHVVRIEPFNLEPCSTPATASLCRPR